MDNINSTAMINTIIQINQSISSVNETTVRPYWMNVLDNASAIIMTVNLVVLMLGMGAATYFTAVWENMKHPLGCLIGMICQFGMIPAVGFGFSIWFKLPPYQALSVLILTCSPGGAFSNFFTYWVNGDVALSILMTTFSSLIAFGGMPLNLWIYARYWTDDQLKIPYMNVFISMCFVTIPAIIGMIIRHYSQLWANRISMFCGLLGWAGALICGAFLVLIYYDIIVTSTVYLLITGAVVPLIGFLFAFIISKIFCLSNKKARTIGIESGCQNMVVAMNVMLISFPDPKIRGQMILFPIIYGIFQLGEIFVGIIIFQIYKFIRRNEVTEEEVKSVIDNTILTKVQIPGKLQNPVPALNNITINNSSAGFSRYEEDTTSREEIVNFIRSGDVIRINNPSPHPPKGGFRPSRKRFSNQSGSGKSLNTYEEYETSATLPLRRVYNDRSSSQRDPPRSPSLNSGYEFNTFRSSHRFYNDDQSAYE